MLTQAEYRSGVGVCKEYDHFARVVVESRVHEWTLCFCVFSGKILPKAVIILSQGNHLVLVSCWSEGGWRVVIFPKINDLFQNGNRTTIV